MEKVVIVTKEFLGLNEGDQLFLDEETGKYMLVQVKEIDAENAIGEVSEEVSLEKQLVEENIGEYFEVVPQTEQVEPEENKGNDEQERTEGREDSQDEPGGVEGDIEVPGESGQ